MKRVVQKAPGFAFGLLTGLVPIGSGGFSGSSKRTVALVDVDATSDTRKDQR